jgi:hypothetical protein
MFSEQVCHGLLEGLVSRVAEHCSTASAILRLVRTAISFGALCGGDVSRFLVELCFSAECPSKRPFGCSPSEGFIWCSVRCQSRMTNVLGLKAASFL